MAIRQIRQSFPPPNIPSIQYTVGGPIIQMVFWQGGHKNTICGEWIHHKPLIEASITLQGQGNVWLIEQALSGAGHLFDAYP